MIAAFLYNSSILQRSALLNSFQKFNWMFTWTESQWEILKQIHYPWVFFFKPFKNRGPIMKWSSKEHWKLYTPFHVKVHLVSDQYKWSPGKTAARTMIKMMITMMMITMMIGECSVHLFHKTRNILNLHNILYSKQLAQNFSVFRAMSNWNPVHKNIFFKL